MPVSGSANPNEPPAPGVPNARSPAAPNRNAGNAPGLVCEQVAYRHVFLAVGGELGPVARDGGVVVDPAARVRQRGCEPRPSLGAREDGDERVLPPRRPAAAVPVSAPEVYDLAPAAVHRARRTDL